MNTQWWILGTRFSTSAPLRTTYLISILMEFCHLPREMRRFSHLARLSTRGLRPCLFPLFCLNSLTGQAHLALFSDHTP